MHGGGVIEAWSLDSTDSGRGRAYALVVIDEAAMVVNLEDAWQQSIRPTLTDFMGGAWFLSTPKGMSYFKTLFDRGQDPANPDWASWQMPTSQNPHVHVEEVLAARADLTEAAFNQEYLALFVNWEGSVFPACQRGGYSRRRRPARCRSAVPGAGCDWGRSYDYTVFAVLDLTARAVVAIDRSHRVDYTLQCERLKALAEQ